MKKIVLKLSLSVALLVCASAQAADVGISVQFGQPGFYGRLDLGNFQQPQLIYREPRIVERVTVRREPLYLVVPPGHAKKWEKHCSKYHACGHPVYFVEERWYNEVVVARHRDVQYHEHDRNKEGGRNEKHGHGKSHGKGKGHDKGNRDD